MNNHPIKTVIADDSRFFCDALKDSLNQHQEINVAHTFTTINELIKYTNFNILDVLILDVNFNGKSSLNFITDLKKTNKDFKIIVLTTLNNNFIREKALKSGVDVFVGKDEDLANFKEIILNCFYNDKKEFKKVKSKIKIGHRVFTKRKIEVLQALYIHSNKKEKELSKVLNITESSLKSHKRELFEITNTKSTPELIKFGIQQGLIIA